MPTAPLPVVKAFLICDTIIQDHQNGKKSLIGVFHELRADRFPAVHPVLWSYANLTDAHGSYEFQIRLIDVARNEMLGQAQPPALEIPEPLQTTDEIGEWTGNDLDTLTFVKVEVKIHRSSFISRTDETLY